MTNETLEVLKTRRSIKKFRPEQITDEELEAIIEAGRCAPSGMNTQSSVIIAVQNPEDIEKLDKLNSEIRGIPSGAYHGAPTIILILASERAYTEEIGKLDASAVCMNMLNAAHSIGVASCWIHRCRQMFECEEGREFLKKWGIDQKLTGVASIALGYAGGEPAVRSPRRDDALFIIK